MDKHAILMRTHASSHMKKRQLNPVQQLFLIVRENRYDEVSKYPKKN
jgi:hypothetical protein